MKFWIRVLLTMAIVALFIVVGVRYGHEMVRIFQKFPLPVLLLLALLQIPCIAAGGLAFDFLTKPYHIQLATKDWLGLSFIANLLNQFLPYRPGMGFRYWYLQHHYAFTAKCFFAIMLVYLALLVCVSTVFSFISWLFLQDTLPPFFNTLFLGFCSACPIIMIAGILLKKNHFFAAYSQLQPLLSDYRHMLQSLLVMGAMLGLIALIFYLVFAAVGAPLSTSHCMFLVGMVTLASIVPITPGNMGVLETFAGTLTLLLYKDFALGFSAVMLFRVTQWIPSILLGAWFSFWLLGTVLPPHHFDKPGSMQDS